MTNSSLLLHPFLIQAGHVTPLVWDDNIRRVKFLPVTKHIGIKFTDLFLHIGTSDRRRGATNESTVQVNVRE